MANSTPPTVVDLTWSERLTFDVRLSKTSLTIDSAGTAGPSPVELLAAALAGCMAIDLVHILTRGRHPIAALHTTLTADRQPDDPHRFTAITMHHVIGGDVPEDAVVRAIDLSREKYCSVWHSMRQDIDLRVTFARGG